MKLNSQSVTRDAWPGWSMSKRFPLARTAVLAVFHATSSTASIRDTHSRISETMTLFTPEELADESLAEEARAVRSATDDYLSFHLRNIIQGAFGLITMIGLLVALWQTNHVTTLLLVCALTVQFPFVAYSSTEEGRAYEQRSKQERFADYYAQQLVFQHTATELSSLGTGTRMASWTRARYEAAVGITRRILM